MIKCENGDCWIEGQGNVIVSELVAIIGSFCEIIRENYEGEDPEGFVRDVINFIEFTAIRQEGTHGESREEYPRA